MKAKRFLVFTYCQYYPGGGWSDFKSTFDTKEECLVFLANNRSILGYDEYNIVDLENIEE